VERRGVEENRHRQWWRRWLSYFRWLLFCPFWGDGALRVLQLDVLNNKGETLPSGSRVTPTALARPLRILALPSFENLMSLCVPRVNEGAETLLAALVAQRRDLEDVVDSLQTVHYFEDG
jgi:hypothetical protein